MLGTQVGTGCTASSIPASLHSPIQIDLASCTAGSLGDQKDPKTRTGEPRDGWHSNNKSSMEKDYES